VLYRLIQKPTGVLDLLAENLPTASNFYISYFILQGLAVASGVLSQVVGFILFRLFYKFMTGSPRKMYQKWTEISALSWGSTLPVYTCIAVIGKMLGEGWEDNEICFLTDFRYYLFVHRSSSSGFCHRWHGTFLYRVSIQHLVRYGNSC
jgi:Calcium-dependent channel, 7TM region, putative phosphate